MKQTNIIAFTAIVFAMACGLVACTKNPYKLNIHGVAPIYETDADATIKSSAATEYVSPGKIYQRGTISFQIDNAKGIHIIDCSNIAKPTKIGFIKIRGISEMAIKDNVLYADYVNDLVAIDITDLSNVHEIDRVKKAYDLESQVIPPTANTYFECVDENKGAVIGWEEKDLINPKCKTN
jgi:hypothetical protein